jgi:hypothetical protein
MWRSFFLAIGISLCIVGAECLVVDEAVLAKSLTASPASQSVNGMSGADIAREIKTQEWMPYSFLATGAVIILYTITIPKRLTPA